jgi:hypothetical protein
MAEAATSPPRLWPMKEISVAPSSASARAAWLAAAACAAKGSRVLG